MVKKGSKTYKSQKSGPSGISGPDVGFLIPLGSVYDFTSQLQPIREGNPLNISWLCSPRASKPEAECDLARIGSSGGIATRVGPRLIKSRQDQSGGSRSPVSLIF